MCSRRGIPIALLLQVDWHSKSYVGYIPDINQGDLEKITLRYTRHIPGMTRISYVKHIFEKYQTYTKVVSYVWYMSAMSHTLVYLRDIPCISNFYRFQIGRAHV